MRGIRDSSTRSVCGSGLWKWFRTARSGQRTLAACCLPLAPMCTALDASGAIACSKGARSAVTPHSPCPVLHRPLHPMPHTPRFALHHSSRTTPHITPSRPHSPRLLHPAPCSLPRAHAPCTLCTTLTAVRNGQSPIPNARGPAAASVFRPTPSSISAITLMPPA